MLGRAHSTIARHLNGRVEKKVASAAQTWARRFLTYFRRRVLASRSGNRLVAQASMRQAYRTWPGRAHVSLRTIQRLASAEGVRCLRPRSRCMLRAGDLAERIQFARKYVHKGARWWQGTCHFDMTHIQAMLTPDHVKGLTGFSITRDWVLPGDQFRHDKPKGSNRFSTGAAVNLGVAYMDGRVWALALRGRMTGKVAAKMYRSLARMVRRDTGKRRVRLFEDNCPTQQSKVARAAKRDAGFVSVKMPRRSPDMSILDRTGFVRLKDRLFKAMARKRWKKTGEAAFSAFRSTAVKLAVNGAGLPKASLCIGVARARPWAAPG